MLLYNMSNEMNSMTEIKKSLQVSFNSSATAPDTRSENTNDWRYDASMQHQYKPLISTLLDRLM